MPLAALSLSGRNLGITLSLLLAAGPLPPRRAGKWVQSPEPSSPRAKVLFQAHEGAEPPPALAPVPGAGSDSQGWRWVRRGADPGAVMAPSS